MAKFIYIFTLFSLIIISTASAQQPYLEIENRRGKTVRSYTIGDEIEYLKYDTKEWKKDYITYFDSESGYIGMSNELLNIRDIEKVRYRSDAFLQTLRIALFTAAVSVTIGATVAVINENEDPKIMLYGVPFAAVGFLIPKKRNRVIRLKGRFILKIVDLQKGLLQVPAA